MLEHPKPDGQEPDRLRRGANGRDGASRLALLPVLLLCTVALIQVALSRTLDLSPWKGGGFGMFSTNDDQQRPIRIWVTDAGGEREILTPEGLGKEASRVTAMPSKGRLIGLARSIARREDPSGETISRVRVSVWRLRYAPRTLEPDYERLQEVEIKLDNKAEPQ